mmetsp:Transcript_20118/g.46837  ORF Transcript_20118/g.46837 Transcript_20118/m.46837 type:complete len:102 (+) Transcript_20118:78-383(+)
MGVCGPLQVTLRSPRPENATVETWSLPAYAITFRSFTTMMATGEDLVIIHSRIAKRLHIQEDDTVEFGVDATGDTFSLKVKVRNNIQSDVQIHDFFTLDLA